MLYFMLSLVYTYTVGVTENTGHYQSLYYYYYFNSFTLTRGVSGSRGARVQELLGAPTLAPSM